MTFSGKTRAEPPRYAIISFAAEISMPERKRRARNGKNGMSLVEELFTHVFEISRSIGVRVPGEFDYTDQRELLIVVDDLLLSAKFW